MEREIIKIAVTPQAKAAIEQVCDRYGMTQIELASRLYLWFSGQEEVTQAAVLGILPQALAPDIARLVLERLAESGESGAESAAPDLSDAAADAPKKFPVPRAKAAKPARSPVHVTRQINSGKKSTDRRRPGRGKSPDQK